MVDLLLGEIAGNLEQSSDVFADGVYDQFLGWVERKFKKSAAAAVRPRRSKGGRGEVEDVSSIKLQTGFARALLALPTSGKHERELDLALGRVVQDAAAQDAYIGRKVEGLIAGSLALVAFQRGLVAIDQEQFERLRLEVPAYSWDIQDKVDAKIDRGEKGIFLVQFKCVRQKGFLVEKVTRPEDIEIAGEVLLESEHAQAMLGAKARLEAVGKMATAIVIGVPRYNVPGMYRNVLGAFRDMGAIESLKTQLDQVGFL